MYVSGSRSVPASGGASDYCSGCVGRRRIDFRQYNLTYTEAVSPVSSRRILRDSRKLETGTSVETWGKEGEIDRKEWCLNNTGKSTCDIRQEICCTDALVLRPQQ